MFAGHPPQLGVAKDQQLIERMGKLAELYAAALKEVDDKVSILMPGAG